MEQALDKMQYTKMLSSAMTTELATTHISQNNWEVDGMFSLNPSGQYDKNNLTLVLKDLDELTSKKLTPRAHKLFDCFMVQLGHTNNHRDTKDLERKVTLNLNDYIELLGRPNTKSTKDKVRKEIMEDLRLFNKLEVKWDDGSGIALNINFLAAYGIKNGIIYVNFTNEFLQFINTKQLIQYPLSLLQISTRSPLNYYLGRKLATHYSITSNQKRGTHNIIKVQTLLDAVQGALPTYKEVMEGNRNTLSRIIRPFEKALNQLQTDKIIKWQYTGSKHQPLDKDTLKNNDYNIFIDKMVSFELLDYPPSEKD